MSNAMVHEWEQKTNGGPPSPHGEPFELRPADAKPRIWLGAASDARIVFIGLSVIGTTKQYPHREGRHVEGRADNNATGAIIGTVSIIVSITAIVSKVPIVSMIGASVINLFGYRRRLDDTRVHDGDRPRGGITSESRCEQSDA